MPQQTNLNVAPYFDDFDANNDFHKVLFKPGYPVQARELTTLQSILQNQVERFGQHFFKEGAKVIPGNTSYSQFYRCIQLENTFQGVPVSAYADQLVGTKITGLTSGVTAYVDNVLNPEDSERGTLTLYINYLGSSTTNNATEFFSDGENLACDQIITSGLLGNTTIDAGAPFASTIATGAAETGSSFSIQEGVYFVRGQFVNVATETLILDQYNSTPSYRVGLLVTEEIITADLDETLNDNSQGFNNYSAPGADRLKISVRLSKKPNVDFQDDNFVELARFNDGVIKSQTKSTDYSLDFIDILARRTFAESGNYTVRDFDVSVENALDDGVGSRGIFSAGQFTPSGTPVTENQGIYKISPGKAFVKGYEIETIGPTFIDFTKTRTVRTIEDESIIYNTGPTVRINNVYGAPKVGMGNTFTVSLRDTRIGSAATVAAGSEIGLARVYDFSLESGSYNSSNGNINEWDISLFDVQTFTTLTLNEATTLNVPTFVKGEQTGATAFIRSAVSNSKSVTLYDVQGKFNDFEPLTFNGVASGFVGVAVTEFGISDVKSIHGVVGAGYTFNGDTIQSPISVVGVATISATSGAAGISTVRSTNPRFPTGIRENNLVRYSDVNRGGNTNNDPVFARVVSVGSSHLTITGVTTVTGVAIGGTVATQIEVQDFTVLGTNLEASSDNTLYTALPKANVSNVDLTSASINIRKEFTVNIASNTLSSVVTGGDNETFTAFDEERYALIRTDGSTEVLTADRLVFSNGGKSINFLNLGANDTGATLIATLKKEKPKSKVKIKNRVKSVIVDKSKLSASGAGSTTLNDGLTFGSYPFGTRVQDEIISLNVPDIIEIHGIFESSDTAVASCPTAVLNTLTSSSTTTTEFVIGEKITGQTTGAIAIVAEKVSDSKISFIYKNDILFKEGETIVAGESDVEGVIQTLDSQSFDVSQNFVFDDGQEGTIYNIGTLKRKAGVSEPAKQLKVYFSSGSFESTDDGDITTVSSYDQFDYGKDLNFVNFDRVSDIIDIRPRASEYTVAESTRSPLEFLGRSFNADGNSATSPLATDESILVTFSYYLGRIDRIFLTKDGAFQVKYGEPSERPVRPGPVDDAIEIATITLPPYLYRTQEAGLSFLEQKRYRMSDIRRLENRIRNLEYYTALSILETNTANLFVPDSEGLNRFKSGFFVDNFNTFRPQEESFEIKNSIDLENKELRPKHYTTSVDLIFGPVINPDPTADKNFTPIEGTNVRRNSDIVTLDYAEVNYLEQSFATRVENVTPFLISFWQGSMELTPATDTWVDQSRLEAKIINTEGDYSETFNNMVRNGQIDRESGFGPIVWNSWRTNWTGIEIQNSTRTRNTSRSWTRGWTAFRENQTLRDTLRHTVETGIESRTGNRTVVTEVFDQTSVGDRVISRDLVAFMRSRNITFNAKRMKPLTQMYAFFDGKDVTKFCVPKLLEIQMISGTFTVGETVTGSVITTGLGADTSDNAAGMAFRVAQCNHREGPYNAPSQTYVDDPYNNQALPSTYSSTSTVLNVDVLSMSEETPGQYGGYLETGATLVGSSSGARATVTNVRLVTDLAANLIGSFFIPTLDSVNHPRFETGDKTLVLVNEEDNDQDAATTIAEEKFTASGTLETVQENIISVRNARVENRQTTQNRDVQRTLQTEVVNTEVLRTSRTSWSFGPPPPPPPPRRWGDPLAQSFQVEDEMGVFLTRCDVFFRSKDDMDIPITLQVRSMEGGVPSQVILPFSEVSLDPSRVNISADGSVATTFQFAAPVYLTGNNSDYCIVLISNSTKYEAYISRVGENDLITQSYISQQPYLGSLFKSQNASTWEPSQWEDLKFTLYRADFLDSGSVEFYNPELSDANTTVATLQPNSLNVVSRQLRVGLGTTVGDSNYALGNTFSQLGTNATGDLLGTAGIATGSMTIINAGLGYTPASGNFTFNGVDMVTVTGNGRGAKADITIQNGVAVGATFGTGGSGYQVGDVLTVSTIGVSSVGQNLRLSVAGIGVTQELILGNVQGNFVVGSANTVQFVNSSGITTDLNYDLGGDVQVASVNVVNDGLHIKVNHRNHGMYFDDNRVSISGVLPDIRPTKLSTAYNADSTSAISVDSSTNFSSFENVGVGTTNKGYLLIGKEIIEYDNVSGNNIGGNIVRGSNPVNYPVGTPVYKYENSGVNLQRINKTHDLNNVTVANPITFDSYNVKIDMTALDANNDDRSNDVGFPALYLNNTKSTGGYNVKASQNIPFEIVTPVVHNMTVKGTSLTGELRMTTSKSLSGSELPYLDTGFETITFNEPNFLETPRMVASKVNEDAKLASLPGAKSMNMRLFLNTTDSRVSPVIDAQRVSAILTSNRANSEITNFATDSRVNTIDLDPTACQYLSKEITLEQSATSLKINLSAHVNLGADIRAFYMVGNEQGTDPIFSPFPGYKNLNVRGQVIDAKASNGESDVFVPKSNIYAYESQDLDFKEYEFTIDELPAFRTYRIKLLLTSTSQVHVPRVKDLRVIALA